ncbi:class I SAM-dependent methyltransferase [Mycobacterium tilburgii]|uniref:class I SAM-dependent methyltransferase n=1 Tax=Mycobacterium tilburgii TaxID=44467 RepID=UPI0021B3D07E|nr:class I SAM-dependent methyltransferase [Mycobacterium tilburgii]
MTSLSTEPSLSERQPHLLREVAESFGVDADRYDRSRPRYPEDMIRRVIDASPGPEFLDVRCGTGIGVRQYWATGVTVLGVDPDPRMAEVARRSGIEVEIGNFETWDARSATADTRRRTARGKPQTGHGRYPHRGRLHRARAVGVSVGASLHARRVAGPSGHHRHAHRAGAGAGRNGARGGGRRGAP